MSPVERLRLNAINFTDVHRTAAPGLDQQLAMVVDQTSPRGKKLTHGSNNGQVTCTLFDVTLCRVSTAIAL